jgi:hypothetical protein
MTQPAKGRASKKYYLIDLSAGAGGLISKVILKNFRSISAISNALFASELQFMRTV